MECTQYPMERLESRVLLSGSITGTVTGDPNAVAFLDLKGTGSYVDGEPTARVDGSGHYSFTGLAAGKYVVKLEHPLMDNWLTYLPVRGNYAVNLKADQNFTGADFTHYIAYTRGTNDQVFVMNGTSPVFVGKFKADGTRDTTFGNLGIVRLPRSADETGYVKSVTISGRVATITYETTVTNEIGKVIKLDGHGKVLSIISATGQRLPTVDPSVRYGPARPVVGGQISGTIFNDDNFNGVHDPGEPGVAQVRVFLDQKHTGVFATGDPIATTDTRGHYLFSRLRSGNLLVRMLPVYGRIMTSSAETGLRRVLVRPGDNVVNQDFGILDTFLASPTALFPGSVTKLATGKLLIGTGNRPSPLFRANTSAGFLTRYNIDGTIDASYGKKGSIEIPFLHPFFSSISNPIGGISGILHAYSDGSVIAQSNLGDGFYTSFNLWTLIDSTGHLIRTIEAGGRGHDDLKAYGGSMAVTKFTSDGSIIAAGSESTQNSFFGNGPDELAVWKFNADLTPDKSFGPFGQKIITNVLNPNVQDIRPLADGGMQVILNGSSPVTISNTGQAILSSDQIVPAPTDFSATLVGDGEVALQFNDPSTGENHFVVEMGGSIVASIPGTPSTGRRLFLVSHPDSGVLTGYQVRTVNTNYESDPTPTGYVTFKFNSDVSHNYTELPDGSFISFFLPDSQNPNLILHSDFKDTTRNFPNVTIAVPPPVGAGVSQVLHANRMIVLNNGDYLILVQADQSGNGINGPLQYLVRISPAGVIKSTTLVGDLYRANGDNRPGPTVDVMTQTADGKIMLAGTYGTAGADPSQFYFARFNEDLSQDQSFGTVIDTVGANPLRGVAVTINGKLSIPQGVGVMADGTILLSSDGDAYVFNADGTLQHPIAAPADLTVTLSGTNTVHLQLTNNAANATEVVIQRKDGQTGTWRAINGSGGQIATAIGKPATPGAITFDDALYSFGTPEAHTYQYRAFAANDSIRSGDSQTVSLTVTI